MILGKLRNALVRGLVVLLPVTLTAWLLWWMGSSLETLLRRPLELLLPAGLYRPGMGIAAGLVVLVSAGLLVNAFLVRRLFNAWEALMDRIPLVKSIYGAVRDFVQMLPADRRRELQRVVLVRFGDVSAIGFVTRDDAADLGLGAGLAGSVAVYFPMSYQIGGYTLMVPREQLQPLDLPVETAMRIVLTGGMSGGSGPGGNP